MRYCLLIFTMWKLEHSKSYIGEFSNREISSWFFLIHIILCIFLAINLVTKLRFNPRFSTPINIGPFCKHERAMVNFRCRSVCEVFCFVPDQSFHSCILFSSNKSYVPATRKPRNCRGLYYTQLATTPPAQAESAKCFFVACAPCSNNDTKPFANPFFTWRNILFQNQQRTNGWNRNIDVSKPEAAYSVRKVRQYFPPYNRQGKWYSKNCFSNPGGIYKKCMLHRT